jgi:hypothetical protein
VKIACTREEVFYIHRGRHPVLMWLKTGFRRTATSRAATSGPGSTAAPTALRRGSTFYTGVINPVTYKMPVYKFQGARVHQQAAVRPQARPRHAAAPIRARMSARQGRRAARLDPADLRRRIVQAYTKTAT